MEVDREDDGALAVATGFGTDGAFLCWDVEEVPRLLLGRLLLVKEDAVVTLLLGGRCGARWLVSALRVAVIE